MTQDRKIEYRNHYARLIAKARARTIPHPRQRGSVERHHVIPKCLGGRETKENLVELSPREHLVAHLLLAKAHPDIDQLVIAAFLMTKKSANRSSRSYHALRVAHASAISKLMKGHTKSAETLAKMSQSLSGLKRSPETRARISQARKGTKMPPRSAEWREAISRRQTGRPGPPRSKEHRAKISAANRGKPKKRVACPHCGHIGPAHTMPRKHMDKCERRAE